MSPQIRCPNCGITINSENRRKTDLGMIVKAVQKKPRSFTDLLKITELPRKTLSLRLKELMGMDVLTKNGLYYFNEEADGTRELTQVKSPIMIRRKMLLAIVVLAIMVPVSLQAYALFQPKVDTPPTIKGYFVAHISVETVQDLYGWSAVVSYDADKTRWVEIIPGSIDALPYFLNNTFPEMGLLLVGGLTQIGKNEGVTGSDLVLVSIKFGYYYEDFVEPYLIEEYLPHKTTLLDSKGEQIPTDVLKLEIEQ